MYNVLIPILQTAPQLPLLPLYQGRGRHALVRVGGIPAEAESAALTTAPPGGPAVSWALSLGEDGAWSAWVSPLAAGGGAYRVDYAVGGRRILAGVGTYTVISAPGDPPDITVLGSLTCAELAALGNPAAGDAYTALDSGTVGETTVSAGDIVAWDGEAWHVAAPGSSVFATQSWVLAQAGGENYATKGYVQNWSRIDGSTLTVGPASVDLSLLPYLPARGGELAVEGAGSIFVSFEQDGEAAGHPYVLLETRDGHTLRIEQNGVSVDGGAPAAWAAVAAAANSGITAARVQGYDRAIAAIRYALAAPNSETAPNITPAKYPVVITRGSETYTFTAPGRPADEAESEYLSVVASGSDYLVGTLGLGTVTTLSAAAQTDASGFAVTFNGSAATAADVVAMQLVELQDRAVNAVEVAATTGAVWLALPGAAGYAARDLLVRLAVAARADAPALYVAGGTLVAEGGNAPEVSHDASSATVTLLSLTEVKAGEFAAMSKAMEVVA